MLASENCINKISLHLGTQMFKDEKEAVHTFGQPHIIIEYEKLSSANDFKQYHHLKLILKFQRK